ncbi:MAG: zinc-ribbon domain-containing protein [Byssovorax sp.]
MKITCQSCQSKYTVSDEKVQGKTVKIKCRKCGATILVNSNGVTHGPADAAAVATTDDGGGGGASGSFLVNVGEGDQRSMSLQEIIAAYNGSVITAETYVWADGMTDWQPLAQVESIVAALNNPGAVAAAPAAAPEPEPMAAAPVEQHRAAARKDGGRSGGRDLFGGGMAGGATEEVSSSPVGGFSPRPAPAPSAGRGGEENSMLFSLSALTAKTAPAPKSHTTAKNSEDSGLIDLRALAASASASSSASASASSAASIGSLIPDHAGLFPLGAPPVAAPIAAAPVAVPSIPAPAPNKTPLFIGLGIAIAAIAIVGTFLVMKADDDKPVAAAPVDSAAQTAAVTPPPPPPPVETTAPSAVAAADPASSAVAVAAKTPSTPAKGAPTTPAKGAPTTPAKAGDPKPGTPTTPPPATPKKGNCGCAAGDLMCAMKCSAH